MGFVDVVVFLGSLCLGFVLGDLCLMGFVVLGLGCLVVGFVGFGGLVLW